MDLNIVATNLAAKYVYATFHWARSVWPHEDAGYLIHDCKKRKEVALSPFVEYNQDSVSVHYVPEQGKDDNNIIIACISDTLDRFRETKQSIQLLNSVVVKTEKLPWHLLDRYLH